MLPDTKTYILKFSRIQESNNLWIVVSFSEEQLTIMSLNYYHRSQLLGTFSYFFWEEEALPVTISRRMKLDTINILEDICHMVDLIAGHAQCKLGDGPSSLFWKDSWLCWGFYELYAATCLGLQLIHMLWWWMSGLRQLKHKIWAFVKIFLMWKQLNGPTNHTFFLV